MATRTGILTITGNDSRLDDGTLLARCADDDPFSAATGFLRNQGFQSGDQIQVTGQNGSIGGVAVFCMTAAQTAPQLAFADIKDKVKPVLRKGIKAKGGSGYQKKSSKKKSSSPDEEFFAEGALFEGSNKIHEEEVREVTCAVIVAVLCFSFYLSCVSRCKVYLSLPVVVG